MEGTDQPTEIVRCAWCDRRDAGTGRDLTAAGWRSLWLSFIGTVFFCPICLHNGCQHDETHQRRAA